MINLTLINCRKRSIHFKQLYFCEKEKHTHAHTHTYTQRTRRSTYKQSLSVVSVESRDVLHATHNLLRRERHSIALQTRQQRTRRLARDARARMSSAARSATTHYRLQEHAQIVVHLARDQFQLRSVQVQQRLDEISVDDVLLRTETHLILEVAPVLVREVTHCVDYVLMSGLELWKY